MKNRLKELRQLHQWSQADLARELGISRQAVNGFESGKFDPSLDMAFKIASLFNVALEDAFTFQVQNEINYEAKNSMQTLVERAKNFFGFELGFERFTEDAIEVLQFARLEASRVQQSQVQPEHLLAGLLADPTTISAQLLRSSGATRVIETSDHSSESDENSKFSPESKFVLELALQIVRLQGKKSIETEHLLWGLVRLLETNKTTLNALIQQYEIDLNTLNRELIEAI